MFIQIEGQTNRQTNQSVYRVAAQLKTIFILTLVCKINEIMFSPVMALKLARQVEELQENGEQVEQGWALKLGAKHDPIPAGIRVIFCIYFFPSKFQLNIQGETSTTADICRG